MKKLLKIGIVIADGNEYAPLEKYALDCGGNLGDIFGKRYCCFDLSDGERTISFTGILCGVGKVNAAAGTAFLMSFEPDYIINIGLSGGISGIGRGETAISTTLCEHDFDVSPLGYEVGVKPDSETVHSSSKLLFDHFSAVYPNIKSGHMVTGDCFVSDDGLRCKLAEKYKAIACDMESSAVAAVCADSGVGFLAVRRISDDAGNTAHSDYRAAVGDLEENLVQIVMSAVKKMLDADIFWE